MKRFFKRFCLPRFNRCRRTDRADRIVPHHQLCQHVTGQVCDLHFHSHLTGRIQAVARQLDIRTHRVVGVHCARCAGAWFRIAIQRDRNRIGLLVDALPAGAHRRCGKRVVARCRDGYRNRPCRGRARRKRGRGHVDRVTVKILHCDAVQLRRSRVAHRHAEVHLIATVDLRFIHIDRQAHGDGLRSLLHLDGYRIQRQLLLLPVDCISENRLDLHVLVDRDIIIHIVHSAGVQ